MTTITATEALAVYRRAFLAGLALEQHAQESQNQPSLNEGCRPCLLAGLGRQAEGCDIWVEARDATAEAWALEQSGVVDDLVEEVSR